MEIQETNFLTTPCIMSNSQCVYSGHNEPVMNISIYPPINPPIIINPNMGKMILTGVLAHVLFFIITIGGIYILIRELLSTPRNKNKKKEVKLKK